MAVRGGLFDAEERLRWLSASCDPLERLRAVVDLTSAARHDGSQLGAVLEPESTGSGVWADAAYRSKANLDALEHRGLRLDTRQREFKPSAAGYQTLQTRTLRACGGRHSGAIMPKANRTSQLHRSC